MCSDRGISVLTALSFTFVATVAPASAQTTTRVSVSSDGQEGNDLSRLPSISADGRYVAFDSVATNLVAGDMNASEDVFVHDRHTGDTIRVSVDSNRVEGNAASAHPSISADGRFVAFDSVATNLVAGDLNGRQDVFVHDRDADEDGVFDEIGPGDTKTIRVSVASDGSEGNNRSLTPSISPDGRFVVFESFASNLVGGDTNVEWDVFVHDRDWDNDGVFDEPGAVKTVRVSVSSNGAEGNGWSKLGWGMIGSISADGRFVVFYSEATNLVGADNNGVLDVFVRDRDLDDDGIFDEAAPGAVKTIRVSVSSAGAESNGVSYPPSISGDGRFVAFASRASNLVAGDLNGRTDVFVHDRDVDQDGVFDEPGSIATIRASTDSDGNEGNDDSRLPMISADGRHVVFASLATNLVEGDTNLSDDVFLHDRDWDNDRVLDEPGAVATIRVSVSSVGEEGNSTSYYPTISGHGRYVAFYGDASNLVAGDENGTFDVFVHDLDCDGDGLLDTWEINGIDFDGDGSVDLDLAALGADPDHKDLFIEVDAMQGRAPAQAAIDMLVAAFANAPVDNPDPNNPGITLHIQLDETDIPLANWPNDWADFDATKAARFGTPAERADANWANIRAAKLLAFRYCVFADTYGAGTSSGLAELPGNDFMVTLGGFFTPGGTIEQQAGTFMHELGHNLGLHHGGNQFDLNWPPRYNFKPNYTSVMNYTWQFPMAGYAAGWQLDYSRQALPDLDENCLNEAVGIGGRPGVVVPAVIGNQLCGSQLVPENGPIDWDGDNIPGELCVPNDINALDDLNADNVCDVSPGNVLKGHDDWSNLRYMLWGNPNFAEGVHTATTIDNEMTLETFAELNRVGCTAGDFDCDGDVDLDDFGQFAPCYNGSARPPAPACPPGVDADLDADGDVDLDDFAIFAANYTGAQ